MTGGLDYDTHSDAGVLDGFRNNKPGKGKGCATRLLGNRLVQVRRNPGTSAAWLSETRWLPCLG